MDNVYQQLTKKHETLKEGQYIDVEYVQDCIEETLMKEEHFETAKAYILYRAEREKQRKLGQSEKHKQLATKTFMVTKDNAKKEVFDRKKIEKTYNHIAQGLAKECPFEEIQKNIEKYLVNDIATKDIINLLIKTTINLISIQNTKREYIAGRLASIDLYKKVGKTRRRNGGWRKPSGKS